MNDAEEIKAVFSHIKDLMSAHKEMGLEPPPVSRETVDYMERKASEAMVQPGRSDYPESLEDLREVLGDCKRCKLHMSRRKIVFGEGSPRARLVFTPKVRVLSSRVWIGRLRSCSTPESWGSGGVTRGSSPDASISFIIVATPPFIVLAKPATNLNLSVGVSTDT